VELWAAIVMAWALVTVSGMFEVAFFAPFAPFASFWSAVALRRSARNAP